MSALATAVRRICRECREVELEPAALGDLCPGCALDVEHYREALREQAVALENDRRDKCRCAICTSWHGPAPLGGLRARCRKVRAMREARA